jgi:transcriptional regulator with XRE-family HTH domain
MNKFANYMLEQMHKYEVQSGRRVTQEEFAKYIGVTQQNVSNWISGKYPPSSDHLKALARAFGPEVYDALDLERPDPIYEFLSTYWSELNDEIKRQIHDEVTLYLITKSRKK